MAVKAIVRESWYGRVVAVKDDPKQSEVAIYNIPSEEVKWFPFETSSNLASVFRSMSSLDQPLQVFTQPNGSDFGFLSSSYICVDSITQKGNVWSIETTDASATAFVVDSANKESTNLLGKLRQSRDRRIPCWIVVGEKHEIVDVLSLVRAANTCNVLQPFPSEFSEGQHAPILVEKAEELFQKIKLLSTDPLSGPLTGIPFLYPENGCDQRSHAMTRFIISEGVFPLKVWVHADDLIFSTPHSPACAVKWLYHTAPAVLTTHGLYIIDPAVNQSVSPVIDWYQKFVNLKTPKIYAVSHHVYFFHRSGCLLTNDPEHKDTDYQLALYRNALRLQSQTYGFPPCPTINAFPFRSV